MNGPSPASDANLSTASAGTAAAAANHPAGVAYSAPARKARRVPTPRVWPIKDYDVYALLGGNALVILAMWVRHGGLNELATSAGIVTAIGELAALYGTYLVLIQLVLMSRSPWLDQVFGQDRIIAAHRWVGFSAIWLLVAHFIFTTVGYGMADGSGPINEASPCSRSIPTSCGPAIGLVLFIVVGITSVRAARRIAPRTRPGTRSTSTRTSPSPSASCTSSSSASTSPPIRLRALYWIACTSWPSARCSSSASASRSRSPGATASASPTSSRRVRASCPSTSPAGISTGSRSGPASGSGSGS